MKNLILAFYALAAALLAAAQGQQLTVTISPQTQNAHRGDVVTFQGTIRNDGATDLFINGESILMSLRGSPILPVAFDLQLDDSPFTVGVPPTLGPGAEWSGNLFQITVGIDAPATTYDGSLSVLGGTGPAPYNPLGSGIFHLTVLGTLPVAGPAAPDHLKATAAGSNILLEWTDHANNEEGFSIEQSTDGSAYSVIGLVGADRTYYTAGSLDPATIYFFRVRAFNGLNGLTYSAYSNIALARIAQASQILVPWNAPGWAYMNPMGGPAPGTLPNRSNGTPDPNFDTTWFLSEQNFVAQYDGPTFRASPPLTGVPGNSTTYDSGVGPGPLGFSVMDYWATAGAEFTSNGTTLTTPTNLQRWTGYFRRTFAVPSIGVTKPIIRYLMDDGGYIYLDGVLVATVGVSPDSGNPNQPVADTFTALVALGNEASLQTLDLSASPGPVGGTNARVWVSVPSLAAGTHTLAVSVHQSATNSSDLGLALELSGQPGQTVFTVASDSSAQVATSDTGAIIIARTGDTSAALDVSFEIASGPGQAARGTRYTLAPDSLTATIPAGEPSATITVNPLADTAVLGTETVTLNLAAGAGYAVGTPSSATVQMLDSPINVWKIQEFGSLAAAQGSNAADNAAPAGDGIANILKYALGLDALTPSVGSLPVVDLEDFAGTTHLTLTLTRPRPAPGDISYHFEYQGGLELGGWSPAEMVPGYPIQNGQNEIIKVRDPEPSAGKTKDFMHLRITKP